MRTRILVIEDERSATPAPWDDVFDSEYEVEIANRVNHLRSHIRDFVPHLMIINSERRQISNADLCKELRRYKESARTPILLLTDRSEETIESLDAGADDCLAKPISFREFLLRVRGLLRRAQSAFTLRTADIALDLDRFRVTRAGRNIALGPIQFKLLELLMRTPGCPVLRSDLISGVWGTRTRIDKRTVNVHIMRLRKALMRGRRIDPIRTVRGVGYYLDDGRGSAGPKSRSIVPGPQILDDAERSCTRRSATNSGHQLRARGKRHVTA
jgi:two-component system, OmpR family, phosphate regulon response regulator PhoB